MNHELNLTDGVISVWAVLVAAFTSNNLLIFLSIVLVLIRIYRALKGKP